MNEEVAYWSWTVTYDDEEMYSGISEIQEISRDFLPGALMPGLLENLGSRHPHLRGREYQDWSAQELTQMEFRRQLPLWWASRWG